MRLILVFVYFLLLNPGYQLPDSVNLKIYNNSPYYLKKYAVTLGGNTFSYNNIPPYSFSQYKKVPYIYKINEDECIFVVKGFLNRPYSIQQHAYPIDHARDHKINSGSAILILAIKMHHKKAAIETTLKQE